MKSLLVKNYDIIRKLFLTYGVNSVTMDDISVNIHVSKKTIYKEYTCKDELVKEFFISDCYEFKQQINILKKGKYNAIEKTIHLYKAILTKLFSMNTCVLYDLRKYYPTLLNSLVLHYRECIVDCFAFTLQCGETEGSFHNKICINSIANMFSFLFEAYVFNHLSGTTEKITLQWNEFLDYHFKSVCTLSGVQKWEAAKAKLNCQIT